MNRKSARSREYAVPGEMTDLQRQSLAEVAEVPMYATAANVAGERCEKYHLKHDWICEMLDEVYHQIRPVPQ